LIKKINDAKSKKDVRSGENDPASDNEEVYYDADDENEKYFSFLNNKIVGGFSKWKCKSMIPMGEFLRRLRKNLNIENTKV
jgi:hypothetical protein